MRSSNTYSDTTHRLLFATPVADVLSHYGKRTDHRGYMYYSPFRDESVPSMRVTVNRNDGTWVWADFGGQPQAGKRADGGGCLDLVRRLGNLHSDAEAFCVLEEIAQRRGIRPVTPAEPKAAHRTGRESGIVIDEVSGAFSRRSLRRYAIEERCIPEDLLVRYCKQVSYHSRAAANRRFTAIGFPNNAGGWALRGSGGDRKLNSAWGLSTFGPDGVLHVDGIPLSGKCALFEGFMDFLSYLAWRGVENPGMDVCVLHSAANAVHAKGFVLAHESVRTFFDNDDAGERATALVRSWCEDAGLDFKDGRGAYARWNDVNDAWKEIVAMRRTHLPSPGLRADSRRPKI